MAETHKYGTINYFAPRCFALASIGSLPCGDYNHREACDGQAPADVTPIEVVRVITAERPDWNKVDVNLSPWEHGRATAQAGKGMKACPYEKLSPEYFEWLDGFEEYR